MIVVLKSCLIKSNVRIFLLIDKLNDKIQKKEILVLSISNGSFEIYNRYHGIFFCNLEDHNR